MGILSTFGSGLRAGVLDVMCMDDCEDEGDEDDEGVSESVDEEPCEPPQIVRCLVDRFGFNLLRLICVGESMVKSEDNGDEEPFRVLESMFSLCCARSSLSLLSVS